MSATPQAWFQWNHQAPQPDTRLMLRGDSYSGEAHFVDDRLRSWDAANGYGADLTIDPFAEWRPLVLGSLPATFTVD